LSLEIEVLGAQPAAAPAESRTRELIARTLATGGVHDGHVALQYVDEARITALNTEYRGLAEPTDVLSFGVDEAGDLAGPAESRELGDIVICAPHTTDIAEAIVHGALHLLGMDHETDNGEMLARQAEILAS
jgi:probable rRNA maturation factor